MFSFQPFSKPRLVSIGLLLAILVISLMFSSYAEGMNSGAPPEQGLPTDNTVAVINKDAPASSASGSSASGSSIKASNDSDTIVLGNLSVSDVTNMLNNNAVDQKLIDQKLPSSK